MTPSTSDIPLGRRSLRIVTGSITEFGAAVDALVSADDNHLTHGGGVSAALWEAAGPDVAAYVARHRPSLRLGDVFVTPAGSLPARALLHAVTIDFDAGTRTTEGDAALLYRQVLSTAEAQGFESIALPLLGGRAAGLGATKSAGALGQAIERWLTGPSCLKRIVLVELRRENTSEARRALNHLTHLGPLVEDAVARAAEGRSSHGRRLAEVWSELERPEAALDPQSSARCALLFECALRYCAAQVFETVTGGRRRELAMALATIGYGTIDDVVESRTVSEVAEFIPIAAQLTGGRAPESLGASLTRAALAYTQTATQRRSSLSIELRDALFDAVRVLLLLVDDSRPVAEVDRPSTVPDVAIPQSPATPRAAIPDPHTHDLSNFIMVRVREGEAAGGHASRPPELHGPSTRANGTEHVRRLHALLMTHLDESALGHLDERLSIEGYVGSLSNRVLEKCIRVEDPGDFVSGEFSHHALARLTETITGMSSTTVMSAPQVAQSLLTRLGFPTRRPPVGLGALLRKTDRARAQLPLATATELRNLVASLARDLEFLSIVLIRFLAQAAFREPPEALLRRLGHMSTSQTLATAGLGTLFRWVEQIDKHIESDTSAMTEVFKGAIQRRRIFPDNVATLSDVRNTLTHYREVEGAHDPFAIRAQAVEFVRAMRVLLDYLAEPGSRIFPTIVLIDGIHVDRWGRKIVEATDDAGEPHKIFTDEPLEPGETYFMRTFTNPLRVDPILVPTGQLAWPEA